MTNVIIREFELRKKKNNKYSMRAFAQLLNISPGSLSHILRGNRTIPISKIDDISNILRLTKQSRDELASWVISNKNLCRINIKTNKVRTIICEQKFSRLIKKWEYYLVLSCFSLSSFKPSFSWMEKKTGLLSRDLYKILLDLLDLNLIIGHEGFFKLQTEFHETAPNISSSIIREGHLNNLRKAECSLNVDVKLREFQYITLPTNTEKLKDAKKLINTFVDDMERLIEEGNTTDVYRLSVQLFPLSV